MKKGFVKLLIVSFSLLLFYQCSLGNRPNILLDKYRKIVLVGSSETIHASTPFLNQNIIWYSNDESVVTVSDSGIITGNATGNAVIYVESEDGSYQARCYVTVVLTVPKNIILFIGDGMGPEQVKAAGIYKNGVPGSLVFESFEHTNLMTTYSANSEITDSAASATAMATGYKVNNGVVSTAVPGDNSELETILEFLKDKGKSTGLVTTTHITNATPACFGAHEYSRTNYDNIASDYINGSKPNVLFGGGDVGISISETQSAEYYTVSTKIDFENINPLLYEYVSAQFGTDNLPYMVDDATTYPDLSQMTEKALAILETDGDGFFLLVEGGRIDHAGHINDIERTIAETIEFEDAILSALNWMSGKTDTVLIVTADHETGGLKVVINNGAGILPDVTWSTGYHTGIEVPVYVSGSEENIIFDEFDNTHIYYTVSDFFE
ncbi:MAG: alkaline phosphatase [Spirochaetota bacterium]|nr:MAG: alkaline phosphatase [Spirochaetota bacterium]